MSRCRWRIDRAYGWRAALDRAARPMVRHNRTLRPVLAGDREPEPGATNINARIHTQKAPSMRAFMGVPSGLERNRMR
jgi:hypothetical protein